MSSPASKALLKKFPGLRFKIQKVQQEVFGYAPPSFQNQRTGFQTAKKQLQGVYLKQYYEAHAPIDPHVRKVLGKDFKWVTDKQERRLEKLARLRREGKGPPKKGSGKKKK